MVKPFEKPSRRIFILVVSLRGILAAGLVFGFTQRRRDLNSQPSHLMGIIIFNAPFIIENNYIAAWFNNILIGGSEPVAPPSNQATVVAAATLTSATLSQSQNLSVGDYFSFQQPVGENANGQVLTKKENFITLRHSRLITMGEQPKGCRGFGSGCQS